MLQDDRLDLGIPMMQAMDGKRAQGEEFAGIPSPLRVLVIDDQADLRRCLAQMIRSAGHHVEEAASTADGVRRLQAASLDIILTDLRMPGGSGWEVVRAAHALHPEVPVLVMTGDQDALESDGGSAPLAAGILLKPFRREELLGRLAVLQRIGGIATRLSAARASEVQVGDA